MDFYLMLLFGTLKKKKKQNIVDSLDIAGRKKKSMRRRSHLAVAKMKRGKK